jgi:hypothetical protein
MPWKTLDAKKNGEKKNGAAQPKPEPQPQQKINA